MASPTRSAVVALPICVHTTDDQDAAERADELLERIQGVVKEIGDAHVLDPRPAAAALRDLAKGYELAAEAIEADAAERARLQ